MQNYGQLMIARRGIMPLFSSIKPFIDYSTPNFHSKTQECKRNTGASKAPQRVIEYQVGSSTKHENPPFPFMSCYSRKSKRLIGYHCCPWLLNVEGKFLLLKIPHTPDKRISQPELNVISKPLSNISPSKTHNSLKSYQGGKPGNHDNEQ